MVNMEAKHVNKTLAFCMLIFLMVGSLILSDRMVTEANLDSSHPVTKPAHTSTVPTPGSFIPLMVRSYSYPGPTLAPPIAHSGTKPLDFGSIQADFMADGRALAFNKIGFHLGPGGNPTGYVDWLTTLDAAGVPFFIKSVDHAGHLESAIDLAKASNIPHTIVYRRSGEAYDLPDYNKTPADAAVEHWQKHLVAFAETGLDANYVWLETINEVDKNRSEWLGEFALETAGLALRDGYKWAAFGWSSGEPEPYHWETPSMLAFLRLAGDHPDQIAVALHEYSYVTNDLGRIYPWLVGRVQKLYEVCDRHGIPRPTVLITEFGWSYNDLPSPARAMEQIEWAAWLYSAYPTVRGAAIWYLGGWFNIEEQTQKLIAPVTEYSLTNYFEYVPGKGEINTDLFNPPTWIVPDERPRPGILAPEPDEPEFELSANLD